MISELMQPIINQNDLFVDNNNEPVVRGKVEFLDPVSNNLITVYSYTDDEFVELENPIILDINGRSEQSVFSDRLTYCRLYSYHGLDEANHPIYEFVRDWYAGHNAQSIVSENVYTLNALKDLNPEYNTRVTVIGYHSDNDCGPRYYYWDPNSTLDADNGYVVASNVEASGRWILQFDGPYIPSNYYGVDPQHISNAPALLTYAEQISGKKTAPGIYFVPGHYQNQIWWNTTKRVLLSSNSQFDTGIDCAWVDVIGKPSTWLADIEVSDSSCPVYSSWYKHARAFWNSGSRYKYADGKNWTDNTLTANTVQTKVHFYGADQALTTDTNGNMIRFDSCTFEGTGFLTSDMNCGFVNCEFSDNYYLNASIDPTKITFSQLSGQQPTIIPRHFKKPENVVKVMSKISTTLDMDGLYATGTSDCTAYTDIVNGKFDNMTFGQNDLTLRTLKNVTINTSLTYNGKNLQVINSSVRIQSVPNLIAISVTDNSTVRNGWTLTQGLVSCVDSTWEMDTAKTVTGNFSQSIITGTVRSNNLEICHSKVTTGKIEIYPLSVANPSSHYEFKFKAENSVFNTDVEFKNDSLWDIYFNVKICNNYFSGEQGLRCTYWTDIYTGKRTICNNPAAGLAHIVVYEGNTGNCPEVRYYGPLDCTEEATWFNWNCSWMRGMSNPSTDYKVCIRLPRRYFILENRFGESAPTHDSKMNYGFGMLMNEDTNFANVHLVALSELIADSIDSDFIAWYESQGYTSDFNDFFYKLAELPTQEPPVSTNKSYYDSDFLFYFW